jgi:ABC-2 type transport system ATP-binding protein
VDLFGDYGGRRGIVNEAIQEPAIRTTDITKHYREVVAVEALSLSVLPGEIYGFLGRNGAGKTTTIRMILGLVRPTRGCVKIFGKDIASDRREAVAAIGSLVETATAYPNLTVRENVEIERSLRRTSHDDVNRAIELLGLADLVNRRAGHLSLGNKQRLALARALVSRPRIMVLDEPANGLDPAGIVDIRRMLRRLADEEGVTVFISSHILGEISQLVDRIGIIHQGKLVDEIRTGENDITTGMEVRVSDPSRACAFLEKALGTRGIVDDGILMITDSNHPTAQVAKILVESSFNLHMIRPVSEDLEARFLRLTGGES